MRRRSMVSDQFIAEENVSRNQRTGTIVSIGKYGDVGHSIR